MAEDPPEREFLGGRKAKMWTYLILMVVLIVIVLAINMVFKNPTAMKEGFKSFVGLPSWLLATIAFVVGALTFWGGLKVETDWPEAIGAFLISASVAAFELIFGWSKLEVGLVVVPYLIPLVVFVVLLMVGIKKSV